MVIVVIVETEPPASIFEMGRIGRREITHGRYDPSGGQRFRVGEAVAILPEVAESSVFATLSRSKCARMSGN